jgi:tRNA (cmo5U34)-methyltransferase
MSEYPDHLTSVGHRPSTDKWEFDAAVTDCFDDMLKRSIPQYEVMRQTVFEIACRYAEHKTAIVDLGCSRGEALAPFVDKFGIYNRHIGVETSKPMLDACRSRFKGMISNGVVEILDMDLRKDFPPVSASVFLSVLTLQFIPINYRQQIIQKCYDSLTPGGCLILVEKVLGAGSKLDRLMVDCYANLKKSNGYSPEDIDRKALALEGVLVPVTAKWNEEMLRQAGFLHIDCFWRWMNFAGWVAVKF